MKFLLLITIICFEIFAAPAYNKLREFKQADGSTFTARAYGNQHLNWVQSEDGEILKYNKNSNDFEYAEIKEQSLKASGTRYEKSDSRKVRAQTKIDKIDKKSLNELWSQKQKLSHKRKALSN